MADPTPERVASLIVALIPAVSGDRAAAVAEVNSPKILGYFDVSPGFLDDTALILNELDPSLKVSEWINLLYSGFLDRTEVLPDDPQESSVSPWAFALIIVGLILLPFAMRSSDN